MLDIVAILPHLSFKLALEHISRGESRSARTLSNAKLEKKQQGVKT